MHWTEQAIKSCLDGTFTKFAFNAEFGARAVTADVETDFIPDYNRPPKPRRSPDSLGKGQMKKPWPAEQDALLLRLRAEGHSLNACTEILQRGKKGIVARLRELKHQVAA